MVSDMKLVIFFYSIIALSYTKYFVHSYTKTQSLLFLIQQF